MVFGMNKGLQALLAQDLEYCSWCVLAEECEKGEMSSVEYGSGRLEVD